VYHVTETSFSAFPFGFFPVNMAAVSDEHGENAIMTFPKLQRGSMGNGVQIHWLFLESYKGYTNW
jgi:hypothetical protein